MLTGAKEFFWEQYELTGGVLRRSMFLNSSRKPYYSHKKHAAFLEKGQS